MDQPDAGTQGLALVCRVVGLLLANGQTTERIVHDARRLASHFGAALSIVPGWDATPVRLTTDARAISDLLATPPAGVDMRKVASAIAVIDAVCGGRRDIATALEELEAVARLPPVPTGRFAPMAVLGATSLAVIFGATQWPALLLVAASAGLGAWLRRRLAGLTGNLFVQPLSASLLAGIIGAVALGRLPGVMTALVALCPCMILVPGPHLLNGTLDLVRGRIALGVARLTYAATTILVICTGLLAGLAAGGTALPVAMPPAPVPLALDVPAAGVAVLAYGTFFAMPWRNLPIPALIGMAAHGVRWALIGAHASPAAGAFGACLLVGVLMAPLSDRLRIPFAGCAFAAVVSLIPGFFLFRMASLLLDVLGGGAAATALVTDAASAGTTAFSILVAMAGGLIVPRLLIGGGPAAERGWPSRRTAR